MNHPALSSVGRSLARASGIGDLVASLEFETDLQVATTAGGFRFSCERGGVDYGAAIAFDSRSLKAEVLSSWNGAGIDLVVPSPFLEQTHGQIIIDPIVSTFAIDTFTDDLGLPDIAYDAVNDRYFVVYQDVFSFTDYDAYSVFIDGATTGVAGGTYVESGNADWRRPGVAVVRGPGRFLVVAEAPSVPQPASTYIAARFRDVATNTFGALAGSLSSGSPSNPGGEGTLCVSGSIGRFPVFSSGPNGQYAMNLRPRMIPQTVRLRDSRRRYLALPGLAPRHQPVWAQFKSHEWRRDPIPLIREKAVA